MALLDKKTREQYLKELGYKTIKEFQKEVMYPQWVDGKYGPQTDNALRTAYNVKKHCKNFSPKEFRCECGGKYCGGYPDYMKPSELRHIQTIRDHYGKPITITSGLRCKEWNRVLNGSVENSGHLRGLALDFYQPGVTDTVANRKAAMRYFMGLPNHKFTYGANMAGSDGIYRSAAYMGNAMHTECTNTDIQPGKLNVDGIGGGQTVMAIQKAFGVKVVDGSISGQKASLGKYYTSLIAVEYGLGGSVTVKEVQKWAGCTANGIWDKATSVAVQKKLVSLGYSIGSYGADGYFGAGSMKALQTFLNDKLFPKATASVAEKKPTALTTAKPTTPKPYSGKYPTKAQIKTASNVGIRKDITEWCEKIAEGGYFDYKSYSDDPNTWLCPLCHPGSGDGWNCIGYDAASWFHGGKLGNRCSCDVLNDADFERLRESSYEDALALAQRKLGLNDIELLRDNRGLDPSVLKPGDMVVYYDRNNGYKHVGIYIGNGQISDDSGANTPNIRYGKPYSYSSDRICKVAIRYTGGRAYLTMGDEGEAVVRLHKYLNWYGNYGLNEKGKFGPKTRKAVLDFKRKNGMSTKTGHVGEKTIARMKKVKK